MRHFLIGVPFGVAAAAGLRPNGLAMTPPMGWMSWEIFRCQTNCSSHPDSCIDHNLYRQMTDRLVDDGYLAAGYNQVSIDDCWENRAGRDADGHLIPDPGRFPDGMKALGDYMHSRGVRFGFYSALGAKTCGGFPGSSGHIVEDANTFASWGVDYLKMDACVKNHSELSGYPLAGAALQATDRNITYSCSWPACLGSDESKKPFGAFIDAGCNLWRNWIPDIQCSWKSLSSIIDHWGYYGEVLQPWAGPGHWHDMDMLLIGNDCITIEEQKTQMAIWAISGSPLIMGNDLRHVPDDSKAILLNKGAIAVNQDPLGKMGIRHPRYTSASSTQVWYRELANGDVAVALYNKASSHHPPIPGAPCEAWNKTPGGYLEACGGSGANVGHFIGLTLEQAQSACCEDTKCAGFSYRASDGLGNYKDNQDCGKVTNSEFVGYTKPSQMPMKMGAANITVRLYEVGFTLEDIVSVYDIWEQRLVGQAKGVYTANHVPVHGTAFLRLSKRIVV